MKEKEYKNSDWFWAILILSIQIGLSFISIDWFGGMMLLSFIFGLLSLASALDKSENPLFMDLNILVLIGFIIVSGGDFFYKYFLIHIINAFKRFNAYLDNLEIFNKNSETKSE